MQREATVAPNSIVVVPLSCRMFSCIAQQHVTSCASHSNQQSHSSPDARSMSEASSGFASSANSATAADHRTDTAPPSSNSNSSESCACVHSGSAESLNALIDALQSRHDAFDRSSLRSLEFAVGGSAKWSLSSSSSASKGRLQERYGEDLRRMNFAARVIQQAYRTHRLKCTFTKRCNEKRLSARISSSCIELDANNDVLAYFAQRGALAPQIDPACKKIDLSNAKSTNPSQNQPHPHVQSVVSTNTTQPSLGGPREDGGAIASHSRAREFDDDDDAEVEFVRPSVARLETQNSGRATRPACSCCDFACTFGRMQVSYAQPGTSPGLVVERNALFPLAYGGTHPHAGHSQAQPELGSGAWRGLNLMDSPGAGGQLLVAPRLAGCACHSCFDTPQPQPTHNRFYMTAPYSVAFFPSSQPEPSSNVNVNVNANVSGNGRGVPCAHCIANQLHPHTLVSATHCRHDTTQNGSGAQAQLLSKPTRVKTCECTVARLGCTCERCHLPAAPNHRTPLTADLTVRECDAADSRLRKTPKPKSTVSCASFLYQNSNAQDQQQAVESLYETSPFWKARRNDLASQTAPGSSSKTTSPPYVATSAGMFNNGSLSSTSTMQSQASSAELRQRRFYRVALNLFNRKAEVGVRFLADAGFVKGDDPAALASFLLRKRGFSRQVISEYLGAKASCKADKLPSFVDRVLEFYANGIDMRHLEVLAALRRFQQYLRFCGEAQRIERFTDAFAAAYSYQNARFVATTFRGGVDSVLLLAYAIVMLNTDLHNANVRADRKMKLDDFVRNLSGVDAGGDFDRPLLEAIYEQLRTEPLQPTADHVTQVQKLENCILLQRNAASKKAKASKAQKSPSTAELHLATPERRLVCYCRLYKLSARMDKHRDGRDEADRQRDVFLLNDLLLIAKEHASRAAGKKRDTKSARKDAPPHALGYYELCDAFPLSGMQACAFEAPAHYPYGIRIMVIFNERERHEDRCADKPSSNANANTSSASSAASSKSVGDSSSQDVSRSTLLFYARSSHDRTQFLNDLHETILEATETDYIWNRYKTAVH